MCGCSAAQIQIDSCTGARTALWEIVLLFKIGNPRAGDAVQLEEHRAGMCGILGLIPKSDDSLNQWIKPGGPNTLPGVSKNK